MDPELLRKWKILGDLTDEELNNIAYVIVDGDPLVGVQNAVFITKDSDEVYGVGSNSLFASAGFKLPMAESFASSGGKVKIDRFCGLELEKIVVGSSVMGGLAKSGAAHIWYLQTPSEEAVVMFERYSVSKVCQIERCACGHRDYYTSRAVGGVNMNVCVGNTNLFRTYTVKYPPPAGTAVSKFINSSVAKVKCPKCSRPCSSAQLGGYSLEYCSDCKTYPEHSAVLYSGDEVKFNVDSLVDIACGKYFVALLTTSNDLIVHGRMESISCCSSVDDPDQISIKAISCGANHLAAISSRGELYTCGWGGQGQLGYASDEVDLTLRRVGLEGVVVKVCCGRSATICLMLDGSVYCFGSNMKLSGKGTLLVNQLETDFITQPTRILVGKKCIDIACVPLTNKFYAQTKTVVHSWGHRASDFPFPEVVLGATSLVEALVNQPISLSRGGFSSEKNLPFPSPSQTDYGFLYGKKHLSDFLLKLSDGDFPVHGLVLFSRSAYFRDNILRDTDSLPKKLDMTHYNPVAYKALLKYFYQLPLDDLECSDLVDLYLLAVSYKETDVFTDSYNKLKKMISVDTVKLIRSKAKAASCKDLLEQCDAFMRAPEFQAKIFDVLSQMPDTVLSFLS